MVSATLYPPPSVNVRVTLVPVKTVSPKSAKIYKTQSMQTALKENSPTTHNDFVSLLLSDEYATSS